MNLKTLVIATGTFLLAGVSMALAAPITYNFDNITSNNAIDATAGENQLSMTVDGSGNQVVFTFNNAGPAASSITDIFFDDDVPLINFVEFDESGAGVKFVVGDKKTLPGGNAPAFAFTSYYMYNPESPVQPNGVNPGEWLEVIFTGDVTAVQTALSAKSMRVGIHVQGFTSGGSESFINNPPTSVPEPASVSLILLGLSLLGGLSLVRRKQ